MGTNEPTSTTTGAQAIIKAALEFGAAEVLELDDGTQLLSIPKSGGGREIKSAKPFIDEYLAAPERKKGTASLTTLDSFIAHVNRHKDADTVVFAIDDKSRPGLLAVFDYNRSGEKGEARFGEHRAQYTFPLSDEWTAWMKASSSDPMNQAEFAEFLEDRIGDVMKPEEGGDSIKEFAVNLGIDLATAQQLMTLSRGLKVNVSSRVTNAQNLSSGEGQIHFAEEHTNESGVSLRVPGGFALAIPVFRLGDVWQVPVRLRYRVKGPAIAWTVGLHRTDVIFSTAFTEAVKKAEEATSVPVFFGQPER